MSPSELFRFCPRCAAPRDAANIGQIPLRCEVCGITYFFNPTVAAAAWLHDAAGRVLLIRRAREPAKGKLAIPGGFLDIGETAEVGLRREVREEVGLEIEHIRFFGSHPNHYHYREVTYPVLDLVFTADAVRPDLAQSLDGVCGIEWRFPAEVTPDELAFPSLKVTLASLQV